MARIDDLKREARHVPDELHYAEPEAGNGGWVRMAYTDSPAVLYARFEMRGGGLHLTEVYMRSADCVSGPEASKRIERVTQFVAAMGAHERARFIDRMAVPGPQMSDLAQSFATTFSPRVPPADWVALQWLGQYPEYWAANPHGVTVNRPQRPTRGPERRPEPVRYQVDGRPTYDLRDGWTGEPGRRVYAEDFLERVAAAYRELVLVTHAPNKFIAEASGVPKSTADDWIRKARREGFLPPGQPGRAG